MAIIKAAPDQADRLLAIMSKVYGIGADDFTQATESDGTIVVDVDDKGRMYDSRVYISLEDNGVYGYMSVYPPLGTGEKLTEEQIFEAITEEGVRVNVDEEAVKKAARLHDRDFIVDHVLIAKGVEAYQGKDAVISINFSAADKRPKITADGKVDYKNIDNMIHAKKGDVLISKRPATSGIRGLTVKNAEIIPLPGKDIEIFQGEGVLLNPLGTQYVAIHDGYVEFSNNILAVHEVYYVSKDVDYSTGNITFSGTVHVKGDVLSGFRIEAKKDVIVEGICGDCEIVAHKSIYIKTGIKGNDANIFMAKENAVIGYAEKAKIFARNDVIVKKYSYNSDMYAGNRIDATSGEGIIAGGTLKAYSEVVAKQLGTQGNSKFSISLGTKYYIDQAIERIRKDKARLSEVIGQINEVLGRFNLFRPEVANNPKVIKLQDIKRSFEAIISEMGEKEEELMSESRAHRPKIKVKGPVFEGLTVIFFNSASTVRERIENAVFYLDEKYAEVAWVSLKDAKNFELE